MSEGNIYGITPFIKSKIRRSSFHELQPRNTKK